MTEKSRPVSNNSSIQDSNTVPTTDNKQKSFDDRHTKHVASSTPSSQATTTAHHAQTCKVVAASRSDVLKMWGPAVPLPTEREYYMPTNHFGSHTSSNADSHKDYTYGFLTSSNSNLVYEITMDSEANEAGRVSNR